MSREKQEEMWLADAVDAIKQSPGLQFLIAHLVEQSGFLDQIKEDDAIALARRAGQRDPIVAVKHILDFYDPRLFPAILLDRAQYLINAKSENEDGS